MNDSIWNLSLSELRDRTASSAPTPGGGSIAVISATLGLGLVIMALEITQAKQVQSPELEQMQNLLKNARELAGSLATYADKDIAAFQGYMNALALSKQTEEQKSKRRQALNDALVEATKIPLAAANEMLASLKVSEPASELVHVHVVSDVGAGTALIAASLSAVLLNVDINVPSIKDLPLQQAFMAEGDRLTAEAGHTSALIRERVKRRLTKI